MTNQPAGIIPEWTIGDRLRKARALTGLTTRDFANRIGVSQATVTNAENDNNKVRKITLNAWSFATGVPVEWLVTGEYPTGPPGGDLQPSDQKVGGSNPSGCARVVRMFPRALPPTERLAA